MKFIKRVKPKPEDDDQERKARELAERQNNAVRRLQMLESQARVLRRQ